jgi:hypothetical protein
VGVAVTAPAQSSSEPRPTPCRFGARCNRYNCRLAHSPVATPTGSSKSSSTVAAVAPVPLATTVTTLEPTSMKDRQCPQCNATSGFSPGRRVCDGCFEANASATVAHNAKVAVAAAAAASPPPPPASQPTRAPLPTRAPGLASVPEPCKFGARCNRRNCRLMHPPVPATASTAVASSTAGPVPAAVMAAHAHPSGAVPGVVPVLPDHDAMDVFSPGSAAPDSAAAAVSAARSSAGPAMHVMPPPKQQEPPAAQSQPSPHPSQHDVRLSVPMQAMLAVLVQLDLTKYWPGSSSCLVQARSRCNLRVFKANEEL